MSHARLPSVLLPVTLIAAALLHWIESGFVEILPDDALSMEGSRRIALGHWSTVWKPLQDHLTPLFRLLRLPFDLHFPEWYPGFHALVIAAHLASAVLLFALARRYLHNAWAALVVATLFVWSQAGEEALIWKVSSAYVFSWTFLLLAVWCFTRPATLWAGAAGASLAVSIGFFSGMLLAIPGVLVWTLLLEPGARRRSAGICLGVWLAGSLAWLLLVGSQVGVERYLHRSVLTAARDTMDAYVYSLGFGFPAPDSPAILLAPLVAFLVLRRYVNQRWIWSVLLLTGFPLFVVLLARQAPMVSRISRYAYQSGTFWCILIGCFCAGAMLRWPRQKFLPALAAILAVAFFASQVIIARKHRDLYNARPLTQLAHWKQWDQFFRMMSDHRREIGRPLALPNLRLGSYVLTVPQLYEMCHPSGLPGLTQHPPSKADQEEFWQEVERAKAYLPGFEAHHSPVWTRPRF